MKPVIQNINAFDAKIGGIVNFTWNGNLPYRTRLLIINRETNIIRFNQTIDNTELRHIIPPDILTNGAIYTVQIQVFDKNNNESELSDQKLLYCYTTPTFEFDSLEEGKLITESTIVPRIYYNQPEDEELNEFIIRLYDSNYEIIYDSGVLYSISSIINVIGLADMSVYHIRATGITKHGINMDTDFLKLQTKFNIPSVPTVLIAENVKKDGVIKLTANIKIIDVVTETPVEFIDDAADLRNNYIIYDINPSPKDFSLIKLARAFVPYKECLVFKVGYSTVSVLYLEAYSQEQNKMIGYFQLNESSGYTISTAFFDALDENTEVKLLVYRKGNEYEIKVLVGGVSY